MVKDFIKKLPNKWYGKVIVISTPVFIPLLFYISIKHHFTMLGIFITTISLLIYVIYAKGK